MKVNINKAVALKGERQHNHNADQPNQKAGYQHPVEPGIVIAFSRHLLARFISVVGGSGSGKNLGKETRKHKPCNSIEACRGLIGELVAEAAQNIPYWDEEECCKYVDSNRKRKLFEDFVKIHITFPQDVRCVL